MRAVHPVQGPGHERCGSGSGSCSDGEGAPGKEITPSGRRIGSIGARLFCPDFRQPAPDRAEFRTKARAVQPISVVNVVTAGIQRQPLMIQQTRLYNSDSGPLPLEPQQSILNRSIPCTGPGTSGSRSFAGQPGRRPGSIRRLSHCKADPMVKLLPLL